MNATGLQRTRTIPIVHDSQISQGEKNVGVGGGFQTGPPPKQQRFEPNTEPVEEEVGKNTGKQEPMMLSIEYYLTILSLFTRFKTKNTVWYDGPDAEKKRDASRMVQYRLRGNKITAVYEDETTRDVLATEIDVASKFASLFNASEAARLYELVDTGVPLHDAVLKVINESQGEGGGLMPDTQPLSRTVSAVN